MAEKQDRERFEEEAGLFLKELRLAGCVVTGPFPTETWGTWTRATYAENWGELFYKEGRWSMGHALCIVPASSFEHAKDELMRVLRIRDD